MIKNENERACHTTSSREEKANFWVKKGYNIEYLRGAFQDLDVRFTKK
jgi:hypothetical protein